MSERDMGYMPQLCDEGAHILDSPCTRPPYYVQNRTCIFGHTNKYNYDIVSGPMHLQCERRFLIDTNNKLIEFITTRGWKVLLPIPPPCYSLVQPVAPLSSGIPHTEVGLAPIVEEEVKEEEPAAGVVSLSTDMSPTQAVSEQPHHTVATEVPAPAPPTDPEIPTATLAVSEHQPLQWDTDSKPHIPRRVRKHMKRATRRTNKHSFPVTQSDNETQDDTDDAVVNECQDKKIDIQIQKPIANPTVKSTVVPKPVRTAMPAKKPKLTQKQKRQLKKKAEELMRTQKPETVSTSIATNDKLHTPPVMQELDLGEHLQLNKTPHGFRMRGVGHGADCICLYCTLPANNNDTKKPLESLPPEHQMIVVTTRSMPLLIHMMWIMFHITILEENLRLVIGDKYQILASMSLSITTKASNYDQWASSWTRLTTIIQELHKQWIEWEFKTESAATRGLRIQSLKSAWELRVKSLLIRNTYHKLHQHLKSDVYGYACRVEHYMNCHSWYCILCPKDCLVKLVSENWLLTTTM